MDSASVPWDSRDVEEITRPVESTDAVVKQVPTHKTSWDHQEGHLGARKSLYAFTRFVEYFQQGVPNDDKLSHCRTAIGQHHRLLCRYSFSPQRDFILWHAGAGSTRIYHSFEYAVRERSRPAAIRDLNPDLRVRRLSSGRRIVHGLR